MVEGVEARDWHHCETATLGVLLRHEGLDLPEPLLFGLGAGLSFVYWDAKGMPVPFLGGRVRPFELTQNLAARLGLELDVSETSSPAKAWRDVVAHVDVGRPVGLQLDSFHLEYFSTPVHFGGHVVALYGYDDGFAYLVDTGQQGGAVRTSLESLARARAERGPMTARHRSFTLRAPSPPPDWQAQVLPAMKACAEAFLAAPIANLGHRGIGKAAKLVPGWLQRAEDPRRDLPHAAMLMERGGTGGALFRALYRDFLALAAEVTGRAEVGVAHGLYAVAAALWSEVASLVARAGEEEDETALRRAGEVLREVARVEEEAMRLLAGL